MPRAARVLFAFLWLVSLSACAPVILGRTPTPAAPGVTKVSFSLGYPFGLTRPPDAVSSDLGGSAYWPSPMPITLHVAYGRTETLETNVGFMTSLAGVGVRYGAKERFQDEPVELAFDYGGSLYLTNLGLDAGVLAATPLGEAKLYGALRGFGSYYYGSGVGGGAALTVGGEVPIRGGPGVMLELTFLANLYNGTDYYVGPIDPSVPAPQPVGFSLVPAIAFSF